MDSKKVLQSAKRLKIKNANTAIVIAVSVCSFIVVFSIVASRALLSQRAYQARVIEKKETARDQLKKNLEATDSLITAYETFVSSPENILGGNSTGGGDKDGDNAKIVLDALPSKYDFPALTTSIEKLIAQRSLKATSISGTDDEVNQQAQQSSSVPKSIEIPFQVKVEGAYPRIQQLIGALEASIRPFHIRIISFSGSEDDLEMDIQVKSYYQPERDLSLQSEVVK